MLDEWLHSHGADSAVVDGSLREKTDALLDRCEALVRSGEEPEALDRFVYGQLSPASLEAAGIDSAEGEARAAGCVGRRVRRGVTTAPVWSTKLATVGR
ncbi:hypothetical protein BRD19_09970 [Halobacteriales archaeon SW_7_65_23]|nr:MAG: hypothetical protein BRD19_09970 [Halobacteriales archaeon SW_7_65_23]